MASSYKSYWILSCLWLMSQFTSETIAVTQSFPEPLQHKFLRYLTRDGYWSNVFQLSSLTVGGRERYQNGSIYDSYVARTPWENEIIPSKYIPVYNRCYYYYKGAERWCTDLNFQVLHIEPYFNWVSREGGDISSGAIIGGINTAFEKYFICRFEHFNANHGLMEVVLGYLVPSSGFCLAWRQVKISSPVYEILRDSRYA